MKNNYSHTIAIKVSKKQEIILKSLDKKSAFEYLLSIAGKKIENDSRHAIKEIRTTDSKEDLLANRDQNTYLHKMQSYYNTDKTHVPERDSKLSYLGVEIECLIPCDGASEDDSGESEHECIHECDDECRGLPDNYQDLPRQVQSACDDYCECRHECDSDCYTETTSSVREDLAYQISRKAKDLGIKRLTIKEDGSISKEEDFLGFEFTLMFEKNDMNQLKKLCSLLSDLGAKVNASCGLHVHFDSRNTEKLSPEESLKKVRDLTSKYQKLMPFLAKLVPKSRRDNRFCKLGVSGLSGCRYFAVNLTALEKHKTIEVRLHSSTISFEKISNWIRLNQAIQEVSKEKLFQDIPGQLTSSLKKVATALELPQDLVSYLKERQEKFQGESQEDSQEQGAA